MPSLNFQERFAEMVERGEKRQTIRRVRKRPIDRSDTLYLYTGMRTKSCRLLKVASCQGLYGCVVKDDGLYDVTGKYKFSNPNGCAIKDGFYNWPEMRDWFKKQYYRKDKGIFIGQ